MAGRAPSIVLLSLSIGLTACQTVQTTRPGAVGLTRKQHMIVSEQQVEQAAVKAYAQQEQEAQSKGALDADPTLTARVRRIAHRLIAHVGVFRPDAMSWNWEIHTLKTDEINA